MTNAIEREFSSPLAKLRWGKRHVSTFDQEVNNYLAAVEMKLAVEQITPKHKAIYKRWIQTYRTQCQEQGRRPVDPPDKAAFVHLMKVKTPSRQDLSLIAADAVHNIRQSLEHTISACARLLGLSDDGTFFPMVKADKDVEAVIRGKVDWLPDQAKDVIRRNVSPGGLLWELHDLGNKDKHRLLCNAGAVVGMAAPSVMRASPTGWMAAGFFGDEWDPVRQEIRFAMTGTPFELDYKFKFGLDVRFDVKGTVGSMSAVRAMTEFASTSERIIQEMRAAMA